MCIRDRYFYSVGTTINQLQGDSNPFFYTAPLTSTTYEKPIRVWAVGDMAKQNDNETAMKEAFKKYVDTNYIDGFLMLGDNSYPSGFDQNFQDGFFNYFQNDITKHTVLWPCVGNHESVSYTHLDVYKRQVFRCLRAALNVC